MNLGKFALRVCNRGYIESDSLDTSPEVSILKKLGLVVEEGDVLKCTNTLKDLCTLIKAFKNREVKTRAVPSRYSWLIPILGEKPMYPMYLPTPDSLKEVYWQFPRYINKELQALRIDSLRDLVKNEDEYESRGEYKISILGSLSRLLYSELQKLGLRLKPIICHGTESVVNLVIDGKVDIGFPVPRFRISEIREHIRHIHIIPVNLNVQTQVFIPLGYKPSTVKGWVSQWSTERAVSLRILADSFESSKYEFLDSFEDVVAMISEGYGVVLHTTTGVILEGKLWKSYECHIPLRGYFAVINKETVPASVIKKIEKATRLLERNVRTDPSVIMDAILSSPQHLLEEFNMFYKIKRELL